MTPRVMDATKCMSYLAIAAKGEIPAELRRSVRGMIYGCEDCQSVCPWNVRFSQELAGDSPFHSREFIAEKDAVTLATDILALDQEQFSAAFRNSPMKRAKLAGPRRNAAVVLANIEE